jgi:plasmid replication initiation protein
MTDPKNGDLIAVMENTVAEARHSLTVPEQRLILWLVAQIEKDDDALKEHTLTVLEFGEILGETNNGRLYQQVEDAVKRLQTRVLEIRTGPKERTSFNWLYFARYLDGEGKIQLQFHDHLKPVLLQLRERFCAIPLKTVFQLHGSYSIRWLEILHARQHQGSFYINIEDLRDWLHIDSGELAETKNLQARAIEYPRRDLDKKSPLTFTYKPKKEGRRIVGWVFTVRDNKPKYGGKKPRRPRRKTLAAPVPELSAEEWQSRAGELRELKNALRGGGPGREA